MMKKTMKKLLSCVLSLLIIYTSSTVFAQSSIKNENNNKEVNENIESITVNPGESATFDLEKDIISPRIINQIWPGQFQGEYKTYYGSKMKIEVFAQYSDMSTNPDEILIGHRLELCRKVNGSTVAERPAYGFLANQKKQLVEPERSMVNGGEYCFIYTNRSSKPIVIDVTVTTW